MNNDFAQNQMEILKDIQSSYSEGRLIPFIGAGFSKNIDEKYADFEGFINILGEDIGSPTLYKDFNSDPLQASEYYILKKGEEELEKENAKTTGDKKKDIFFAGKRKIIEKMKDIFDHSYEKSKWIQHNILVNKFEIIYTTNWDGTLEKANNKNIEPVYTKSHLKSLWNANHKIIKFHGHYTGPDTGPDAGPNTESLIVCQTDYLKRISEENPFDIKFKNDLLHNDFVFLGYSFSDPNIILMLHQVLMMISDVYPEHRTNVFWIATEPFTDKRIEILQKRMDIKPYFLLFDIDKNTSPNFITGDTRMNKVREKMRDFLNYL